MPLTNRTSRFLLPSLRIPKRRYLTTPTPKPSSPESILHRRYLPLPDHLSPTASHLLTLTLAPYITPQSPHPTSVRTKGELFPGHYLVYFPPLFLHEDNLLPDGSDATQSPGSVGGGDWPRMMWAGGEVIFAGEGLMLGDGAVCEEEVVKVDRKGSCAGEKVFVWFERRYYGGVRDPYGPRDGEGGWERKEPAVVERRSLVFMKRDEEQEQGAGNEEGEKIAEMALNKKKKRVIRAPNPPDFTLTFRTTPNLLLRFSALTFNCHKIHYDTIYSSAIEGHRTTLCHGPLSQVFLLDLLRRNLPPTDMGRRWRIRKFEYRNLQPMYCGDLYTISGRLKRQGTVSFGEDGNEEGNGRVYELWAETEGKGMSVKGAATVEEVEGKQ